VGDVRGWLIHDSLKLKHDETFLIHYSCIHYSFRPLHDGTIDSTIITTMNITPCDIAAFCAHPDDMELNCGGTLALSAKQGWKTAAVDFTRGELSTRGTPENRDKEAAAAAGALGLSCRVNLGLPDGHLQDTDENRKQVVRALRLMRPRVVIAPPLEDHHADHVAVATILSRSVYLAGVAKYLPGLEPWRPHALLHYLGSRPAIPALVVNISSVFELRMEATRRYRSQFYQENSSEASTRISHPEFLQAIEGRARSFGAFIGAAFGEAYTVDEPVPVTDLVTLYSKEPWEQPRKNN
jgi:bacillithiol biosynthesis deacetylase BshB1